MVLLSYSYMTTEKKKKNNNNIALGFPGDSDGKKSACNAEDPGLIPGSGRSSGEENSYLLLPVLQIQLYLTLGEKNDMWHF